MNTTEPPKIPAGIAMMLKAMGIEPEKVLNSVAGFGQIMADIQAKLASLQTAIANLETRQIQILEAIENGRRFEQIGGCDDRADHGGDGRTSRSERSEPR